jgi:hypothetical protein
MQPDTVAAPLSMVAAVAHIPCCCSWPMYVYAARRAAVGGFIPGYKGHRPGSRKLVGETSYGGVPRDLERTGMRPGAGAIPAAFHSSLQANVGSGALQIAHVPPLCSPFGFVRLRSTLLPTLPAPPSPCRSLLACSTVRRAGMGFGPRNTTSNMELGNNYRGRHPEREEAFLAFAPRATKINAMIQGQDLQSSSMGAMQQEYLRRAAEMQKKRTPFEQRGGWPTPHGQPWDDRELQQRNPGVKPWMTFVEKEMADIRAQRGNRDEDDAPIWW